MKIKTIFAVLLIFAIIQLSNVNAYTPADDATVTETYGVIGQTLGIGSVRYVDLNWITATIPTDTDTSTINHDVTQTITGRVIQVITDPDTSTWGAHVDSTLTGETPADDYDVALKTGDGEDILGGAAVNRDESNTERVIPLAGSLYNGEAWVSYTLTLYITNVDKAGARGRVRVYWIQR